MQQPIERGQRQYNSQQKGDKDNAIANRKGTKTIQQPIERGQNINNGRQNNTQETKGRATLAPLSTEIKSHISEW